MTREETIRLLEMMAAVYPNHKINNAKMTIDGWLLAFGEDDAEKIYKAARHHMNTCSFFPNPADIRKSINRGALLYSNTEQTTPRIGLEAPNRTIDPDTMPGCDICPFRESGQCARTPEEIALCEI
jgi:hypothetical protein